jgi:hypothetical protein
MAMKAEMLVGIAGIVITTAIAIYAILDARNQAKKTLKIWRDLAYLKVKNDLVWEFIDPTESAYTSEIAKGLHEFGYLAKAMNPELSDDAIKAGVEKEALEFAEELVNGGRGKWKKDLNLDSVRKAISGWRAEKNVERAKQILGETKNTLQT